jgi:hypothetical protein
LNAMQLMCRALPSLICTPKWLRQHSLQNVCPQPLRPHSEPGHSDMQTSHVMLVLGSSGPAGNIIWCRTAACLPAYHFQHHTSRNACNGIKYLWALLSLATFPSSNTWHARQQWHFVVSHVRLSTHTAPYTCICCLCFGSKVCSCDSGSC